MLKPAWLFCDTVFFERRMLVYPSMRSCAKLKSLSGWIAGILILFPALAGATSQDEKAEQKAGSAASSANVPITAKTKVSPYAIVNLRRAEASKDLHAHAKPNSGRRSYKPKSSYVR
jgi:hypothetical protein